MRRVSHVIMFVADLERSIAFYRDLLGLRPRFAEHGYAEFDTGGTRFALYERSRVPGLVRRRWEPPAAPGSEVVFEVEDAAAEAERVRRAGVEVLAGPVDRPWGHRTVHLLDPDGHLLELAERIPRTRPRR